MADRFVVTGIPAFDGEYPIDIGSFTMRELQIIKRMSGVRAGELTEAFDAGDSDLIFAICVIAVRRNGRNWEAFEKIAWDVDFDAITFIADEDEQDDTGTAGDAVPLIPRTPSGDVGNSDAEPEPSGQHSPTDGDSHQEKNLRAIGSPG
jgi:hypothetical protein